MSSFGRKSYTLEEATRRMERYCAYQERCHSEVSAKLRSMGMIPQAADTIVVHLIEQGFLSEERFALAFARGKFSHKKWGRIRIRQELRQRDISPYLIQKALDAIDPKAYLKTFEELAAARMRSLGREPKERQREKLYRYLYYRGWEQELILDAVRSLTGGD